MRRILITALLAATALAAAGNASALYMQTPLLLEAPQQAEAGETITVAVRGFNETEAAAYAGATVRVLYTYNVHEEGGGAPDPNSTIETQYVTVVILEELVLDDQARATFEWTVPAELDDRNVDLFLEAPGSDERLAFAYLGIGDAPPMMHILAGSGPAPEPAGEPYVEKEIQGDASTVQDEDADEKDSSFVAATILAMAFVGLAIVLRRK